MLIYTETFSNACSKLTKQEKSRVTDAINKLFINPTANGLHQELIQAADSDTYSARVDDNYRIIYKRPSGNETVFLLYVDKHDDAYSWAKRHKCEINVNGGIQIFENAPANVTITANGVAKPVSSLAHITDEQMKHVHIPAEYWDTLRTKVFRKNQLIGFKDLLSEETYFFLEQVLNGMDVEEEIEIYDEFTAEIEIPTINPIFAQYSDEDLSKISVPIEYINTVKSIKTEEELLSLQNKLPKDAVQNLYALKNGEPLHSIIRSATLGSTAVVETDFDGAMKNFNTQSTAVVVTDTRMLEELMNMPMEKWRVFLHPEQRSMVEKVYNGPFRVLGGAGTGKTVITVHRAKHLANRAPSGKKVLVTTFSKTLAKDISDRLKMICSDEELEKIEITNTDAIAREILSSEGYKIIYPGYNAFTHSDKLADFWREAIVKSGKILPYEIEFYESEWQDVIQAYNISTIHDYLTVARTGRGKQLNAAARDELWAVFEQYRAIMKRNSYLDIDWGENLCAEICKKKTEFQKYSSILVDECQDLRAPGYRMIRALAGEQHQDDLYFAGDSRQQIYTGKASLSKCGININGRSTQLKMNYRTTSEIYESALSLQREYEYDDLDGERNDTDHSICIMHGEKPQVHEFYSFEEEMEAVISDISRKKRNGFPLEEICIVARHVKTIRKIVNTLNNKNMPCLLLDNKQPDDKSIPGIRVATMHRVKGMEFECMYLVQLNVDLIPKEKDVKAAEGDADLIRELMKREANLISVSMTRAKKTAWLSYSNKPTEIIYPLLEKRELIL